MSAGRDVIKGPCIGGPYDKHEGESRFPKGFLAVDRADSRHPHGWCWVYGWDGSAQAFVARTNEGEACQVAGDVNRYRAAEEGNYDVRAMP